MGADDGYGLVAFGPVGDFGGDDEVGCALGDAGELAGVAADHAGDLEGLFVFGGFLEFCDECIDMSSVEAGEGVVAVFAGGDDAQRGSFEAVGAFADDFTDGGHAYGAFAPCFAHEHGGDGFFLIGGGVAGGIAEEEKNQEGDDEEAIPETDRRL